MAISGSHVIMGKHIAASGSLAGEMKVAAISGSTGLTLNQMLIKLDDNATADFAALKGDAASAYDTLGKIEDVIIANDAALRGDAATDYNTLGKLEDFIIALQADVDQNESDSDSAESTLTTNLSALSGGLDGRLDVLEAGAGSVGSVAKAQADAQAYTDSEITALVGGAPGALDTLNELAAAMADDASFSTTITNLIAGVSGSVNNVEAALGAMVDANGAYVAHSGKYYINGNSTVTEDLIDLDAEIKLVRDELTTNGFHTEKDGFTYKMGWGSGKPRLSFDIEADGSVTMSVDVE